MQFLYVFIVQFLYNCTYFERPFYSSSGVHDLLYSAALYKSCECLHYFFSFCPLQYLFFFVQSGFCGKRAPPYVRDCVRRGWHDVMLRVKY